MPKITRATQKIFAQNGTEQLAAFGSMKTSTPIYTDDIEALQTSAYEQGWNEAIVADEAPFLEEMNAVQYGFSKQIAYLLSTGIPEWDENTVYYANTSYCQVNGVLFQSLTDENVGNNPLTTEGTHWKRADNADTDLSNLTAEGENHFTNKNLTNLTAEGEKHFLNKTQLANCILEAPNGVATYSGTTITVKQGLKVLIPNGRNADGTMNNIEYTLPQDLTYTNPFAYNSEYYLWLTYANGTCAVTGASTSIPFLAQEEQPDIFFANNCIWYKPSENLIYFTANYPTTPFTPVRVCFLGKFTSTASNTVTSFTAYPTLEIIKRTDPEIQAPYVYRSYRNGNSWYKLWSDGFIEQGGLVTAAQNGDVVTFLQPYSTVVLDIQITCIWIGLNYNSGYNTATRQNFKFYTAMPSNIAEGVAVNWYSCGY